VQCRATATRSSASRSRPPARTSPLAPATAAPASGSTNRPPHPALLSLLWPLLPLPLPLPLLLRLQLDPRARAHTHTHTYSASLLDAKSTPFLSLCGSAPQVTVWLWTD
jgi:hypothetical protein